MGLPRSGTTLIHQILAAHSKIYGAGEMVVLDQFMKKNINNENVVSLFKSYEESGNEKIQNIVNNYFKKINYIKTEKNIIVHTSMF